MRTLALATVGLLALAMTAAVPMASADCVEPDTLTIHGQECIDEVTGIPGHSLLLYVVKCLIITELGGTCPPPP